MVLQIFMCVAETLIWRYILYLFMLLKCLFKVLRLCEGGDPEDIAFEKRADKKQVGVGQSPILQRLPGMPPVKNKSFPEVVVRAHRCQAPPEAFKVLISACP